MEHQVPTHMHVEFILHLSCPDVNSIQLQSLEGDPFSGIDDGTGLVQFTRPIYVISPFAVFDGTVKQ